MANVHRIGDYSNNNPGNGPRYQSMGGLGRMGALGGAGGGPGSMQNLGTVLPMFSKSLFSSFSHK